MSLKEKLKIIFPKPIVPQKRYIIAVVVIVYAALWGYAAWTPTPQDDAWPDKFLDGAVIIFGDKLDQIDPENEADLKYGEGLS